MKIKTLLALMLCGVFALSQVAQADVTVNQAHAKKGTAIYLNVDGISATAACTGKECTITPTNGDPTGNITFQTSLLANGRAGGASTMSSSSTDMSVAGIAYSLTQKRVGGGNGLDSNGIGSLLPNGKPGQVLTLTITALQSGGTWVVTPVTSNDFTKLTFTAVGSTATLLFVDNTVGWIVMSNSTVTILRNQLP